MVEAFEGNSAETTTMLPTITAFMAAPQLADVTIVADAGMISAPNMRAIEAAGRSFILGIKIPDIPYVVTEQMPVLTQPRPAGPADKRRDSGRLLAARPIYHHKHESIEPTSPSCSPRSRSAGSSRTHRQSASSCAPPAATAPSISAPEPTCSPPKSPTRRANQDPSDRLCALI